MSREPTIFTTLDELDRQTIEDGLRLRLDRMDLTQDQIALTLRLCRDRELSLILGGLCVLTTRIDAEQARFAARCKRA